MANGLVVFLRARLDDDEEVARAASPGPWKPNAEHDEVVAVDDITVADGFALSNRQLRATVDHIVRWDPARALADIEAKRRIIDLYEITVADKPWQTEPDLGPTQGARAGALWLTLRLLALPYAERPDYRQEWKA
jgi:hypothetical protein